MQEGFQEKHNNSERSKTILFILRLYKRLYLQMLSQTCFKIKLSGNNRKIIAGPFKGGNKVVYKVRLKAGRGSKDFAVSLAITPFVSKKKSDVQQHFKHNMLDGRDLHKAYFPEYIVNERTFSTKDPRKKIFVSEWIDEPEEFKDIFENIVANEKRIIELANKYPEFKKELIKFANHILYVYRNFGLMIDLFNFATGKPSNVKVNVKMQIKIIDLHRMYVNDIRHKKSGCDLVDDNLRCHFNEIIDVLKRITQL